MDGKLVLQLLDQLGLQLLLPHYHMLTPGGKDAESISPGTFFLHVTLPLALVHLGPQTALPESRETTFHEFSLLNRLQQRLLSSKVRIYPNCSGCVALLVQSISPVSSASRQHLCRLLGIFLIYVDDNLLLSMLVTLADEEIFGIERRTV